MGNGLVQLTAVAQAESQVVVGIGVVGLDFQGLLVMGDGLVGLPAAGQYVAEVVVGLGVVGLDFQGLAESAMASSTCPRPARTYPRLSWASA